MARPIARCLLLPAALLLVVATAPAAETPSDPADAPTAPAEDDLEKAHALFDELYGADLARVAGTRDPADDADLAAQLVGAAAALEGQQALLVLLCEKACELAGNSPAGAAIALEAVRTIETRAPRYAARGRDLALEVHRQVYKGARVPAARAAAGETLIEVLLAAAADRAQAAAVDDALALLREAAQVARAIRSESAERVKEAQQRLGALARAAARLTRLKVALRDDPDDRDTRSEIVQILLVEFDSPAEASRYVEGLDDADLTRYVPAAAKGLDETPELACPEMGDWYARLADSAPPQAKAVMLARACGYYARFLELHEAQDLARTRIVLALQKAETELERLGGHASMVGRWVNLLPVIDLDRDAWGHSGKWRLDKRTGLEFHGAPFGGDAIRLPVSLEGGYELRIRFQFPRPDLVRYAHLTIPVGSRPVRMSIPFGAGQGWQMGPLPDETGRDREIAPGYQDVGEPITVLPSRPYLLDVAVRHSRIREETSVTVALDGKDLMAWTGPIQLPAATDGLDCTVQAKMEATIFFHEISVRMLSGRLRPLTAKEMVWPDGG